MTTPITIAKVDHKLGIAVGFCLISTIGGEPYFDRQNDHVPDDVAAEAFAKFAEGDRVMKLDHTGSARGKVVWMFPLTADIAKALNITTNQTGVIIGVKPDDPAMLDRFGADLFGFSVGGHGTIEEIDT